MTSGALHLAARDEVVKSDSRLVALLVPEPADARGQALEGHAVLRLGDPPAQQIVLGKEIKHRLVGAVDVIRIARERGPTKRAFPLTEQRSNVGGDEARVVEGAGVPTQLRLAAQ